MVAKPSVVAMLDQDGLAPTDVFASADTFRSTATFPFSSADTFISTATYQFGYADPVRQPPTLVRSSPDNSGLAKTSVGARQNHVFMFCDRALCQNDRFHASDTYVEPVPWYLATLD